MFERVSLPAVFSLAVTMASPVAGAVDDCIGYTGQGDLSVSLTRADRKFLDTALQANSMFLDTVATDKREDILKQFTRLDGSKAFEEKKLRENPQLYTGYKSINAVDHAEGFLWGPYVVSWGSYSHARGTAKILDSILCTSLCQVSNVFERPDESVDLVSRYMMLVRTSEGERRSCPSKSPAFAVAPSGVPARQHPMNVYFDQPIAAVKVPFVVDRSVDKEGKEKLSVCESTLRGLGTIVEMEEEELRYVVERFLGACTVNMSEKSLVPAVQYEGGLQRTYLTPVALVGNLQQAHDIRRLFEVRDGNWTVRYFKLSVDNSPGIYLSLPFLKSKGKEERIDWSYYGEAAGELLGSLHFGRYVDRAMRAKGP